MRRTSQWFLILALALGLFMPAAVPSPALAAAPTELFFSEYIEGSSNNKALEIYNGTGAVVDLAARGYKVQQFSNGSSSASATIPLTGLVADGDVFVLAHSSANANILTQADQTTGVGLYNGDDAVVLLKGETILDVIGQIGSDPGTEWGTGLVSTADNTLRRKNTICAGDPIGSDVFDPSVEWDGYANDTFDGLGAHTANCSAGPLEPKINEFSASTTGTDVEYVEVFGSPDTDYSAYTILEIEGDGTGAGVVDEVITAGTTDAAGLWLASLAADRLENGTITLLLVKDFTGALNNDLDMNNDGMFDATPWSEVADSVAVWDGGTSDRTYGTPVLGVLYDGLPYAPGGASRIPDGMDTDAATDWVRNDFDLAGIPSFTGTPIFGEAFNTPAVTNQAVPEDAAPEVADTAPADGGINVPVDSDVTVTFSEPVNVTDPWFSLVCSVSGIKTGVVSGGPSIFIINPNEDFVVPEVCTLTVFATGVSDVDLNDPPDHPAADFFTVFTTAADACPLPYTPIYSIQGSGLSAAITGPVTTKGVVVGDFEGPSPTLRGFYLQDPTGDGDAATSDGIFVYNASFNNVTVGDVVRVTGTANDYQGQTQINTTAAPIACGTGTVTPTDGTVTPTDVTFPVASADFLEQYEGMLVRLPQTLYVTEHFQLGRFGQVVLSSDGRLMQPTNIYRPGAEANALQAANNLNRIIVDDALNNQNPDPIVFARGGQPLSASNTLRGGDTATGIVGIMTYTWSGNATSGNAYRVRPTNALGGFINFEETNPRPEAAPELSGSLRVAGMNLLNFFNTFTGCTAGVGGATTDCRGAEDTNEYNRQLPKTVAAIVGTMADVVGLVELENDGYAAGSALAALVDALNVATAPGTYAYIDADAGTGQVNALGTDAIKVGLIYKPAKATPIGTTAALNTVEFVNGGDGEARNRPALAQAFEEVATGGRFVVAVNHLKSKGSACDAPDALDGQGNCNVVRTNAANLLWSWLAGDPTQIGDSDALIIGDLNSYAQEDPIEALKVAGYSDLKLLFGSWEAYSYVFDGQWGYLDHALSSSSLTPQVAAVFDWHINADEPSVLDYNTNFKTANLQNTLYAPDEFRIADHDPVLIDLNLQPETINSFVTGGGWFNSPAGAYSADPNFAGQVDFTLNVKYKKGEVIPQGNDSLIISANGFEFNSIGYDWLVIYAGGTLAQYQGVGMVNGMPAPNGLPYRFRVWASDGDPDALRFKIWYDDGGERIVYDNGFLQAIDGGSIQIHKK